MRRQKQYGQAGSSEVVGSQRWRQREVDTLEKTLEGKLKSGLYGLCSN